MHIDWSQKNRLSLAVIALGLLLGVPCANGNFQPTSLELDLQQPNIAKNETGLETAGKSANEDIASANEATDSAFSTLLVDPNDALKWIHLRDQDLTLTFSQNTVLNLTNFVLIHGTLTLEGTTGTMITINVQNTFSLLRSSKIILSGGLQPSDVVFNIIGQGRDVVIRGRSNLTGTLQALRRTVILQNHSIVFGYVNARRIILKGHSQIIPPPIVSP
jgi:hypothetical protein